MIFVYNFLQIILLLITLPLLAVIILARKKYRSRMARRLGIGLSKSLGDLSGGGKVIWMHALSVGEVTSALPLARGIRQNMKDAVVIFSASTLTGRQTADKLIAPYVEHVISAPVDLYFVVNHFVKTIRPDLFILVETDFWPNWLYRLHQKNIPMILVNGRISRRSFKTYRQFRFFFTPLFRLFTLLSMQTDHDAAEMTRLGIATEKTATLGNLKYDTALMIDDSGNGIQKSDLPLPADSIIWLCGSTHRGEEDIILQAFSRVRREHKKLALIIAPRNPARSSEISDLADSMKIAVSRRTFPDKPDAPVLILDTIGELTQCYKLARIAFIGGSLVPCGGHNPLEASVYGVPVLFGPHMDDFFEIARDCIQNSAGMEIHSADELAASVSTLLRDEQMHARMSLAAKQLVRDKSGVVVRHINELRKHLPAAGTDLNTR